MWLAAELLFTAWIALGGWLALRRGAADGLTRTVGLGMAYLAGAAAGWLALALTGWCASSLLARAALTVVAAVAASVLALRWWHRAPSGGGPGRAARCRERLTAAMDPTTARGVVAALALAWIAAHLLLWIVLINLAAAAAPAQAAAIRAGTLVSGALLAQPRAADASAPEASANGTLQQRLISGLHRGVAGGVDGILDASGARRAMEALDALDALIRIDDRQRADLLARIPELERLAAHPAIAALVDDERIMRLVGEACSGSLAAAYALGDEPRVLALFDDPEVRRAIAAVDLVAIRDRLRRDAAPATDAPRWRLATMRSSLRLDATLADANAWLDADGGALVWPGDERYALARAQLAAAETGRELTLRTAAVASCWIDGAAAPPRRSDGAQAVTLPTRACEVVVLLDFSGDAGVATGGPRACVLRVANAAR